MLFPDSDIQRKSWFEDKRMLLLCKGFCGVNAELVQEYKSGLCDEGQQSAMSSLQNYLFNHRHRLSYSERLFEGRAIGSGVVEGACKNLVGRRLKQTGACWRQGQAEKMTYLFQHPDKLQAYGGRCRPWIAEKYRWEKVVDRLEEFLNKTR
ncbi:hypothetical protein FACS1894189_3940 [Planctomycetales bacterium]|nr:hypothetical protein FACS1894189_3940 [Planctomycetales bacterium]